MANEPISIEFDEQSLVGIWCAYSSLSMGRTATDEFIFSNEGRFVWRRINLRENDEIGFARSAGRWSLVADLLKLEIEEKELPNRSPLRRIYFRTRMQPCTNHNEQNRTDLRQLVLTCAIYDDENQEGKHGLWLFPQEALPGEADRNHDEIRAKRKRGNQFDGPFKVLASLLIEHVPEAVARLPIADPLFCVRLYFHDTHAPRQSYCTWIRCLTEPARQRVIREKRAIDIPDYLWHPTMGIANDIPKIGNGIYEADLSGHAEIMSLYQSIYDLLEEDEEENVLKLRACLRHAALTLHMVKWPESCKLTDDFVAFPADGSNAFAGEYDEDMKVCIPAKRRTMLAERGYLVVRGK